MGPILGLTIYYLEHKLLDLLSDVTIKSITLFDHAPVVAQIEVQSVIPRNYTWKLNDSLIQDPRAIERIECELEEFFSINDTPEVSAVPILWESHKVYIRGILMKIGGQKEKEKRERINFLLKEIQELEQQSRSESIPERQDLIRKGEELGALMEQETKGAFPMVTKEKYQWCNKPGKWLARVLWENKNASF